MSGTTVERDDTKNQSLKQQQKWQSLISGKVGTFATEPALFLITEIKGDSKNAKISTQINAHLLSAETRLQKVFYDIKKRNWKKAKQKL